MAEPATALQAFPDPVVTANLYCDRRLDEVVHGALAPLRRAMAAEDPEDLWRLWFVRYPKRGEHLKVRLHGPEEAALRLRQLLSEAAEACFAALPPADGGEPRQDGKEVLPIDLEDEEEGLHPDRVLLWTHYRRSHVSLGGKPLLDDDGYADRMTTCLARAAELTLDALRPDAEGRFASRQRQTTLLRLLIGGLAALGFGTEKSRAYLAYHRDWLLRFTASRANLGSQKIQQTLAQFDQRVDQMGGGIDPIRGLALGTWSDARRDSLDGGDGGWWRALRELQSYLDPFRGNADYQLDPFATDVVFSPVFKVFHGGANQLGLNMLNEAFVHHLLWRAAAV
ncbi:MAG TPA: lantibiotic dehydratase C-terminal domain-containing protein [Thermoanaerobaculia bacterium]